MKYASNRRQRAKKAGLVYTYTRWDDLVGLFLVGIHAALLLPSKFSVAREKVLYDMRNYSNFESDATTRRSDFFDSLPKAFGELLRGYHNELCGQSQPQPQMWMQLLVAHTDHEEE